MRCEGLARLRGPVTAITRDTSTGALVDSIRVECKVAQRHGYDTGLEPQEEMLENFVAARAVFGMSLSFHILVASLGVVAPFMLFVS